MSIPVVSVVACGSYVGPISLGLVRYSKLTRPMRLFLFLCIAIFTEFVIELAFAYAGRNNLEIINFGMLIETVALGAVYFDASKGKTFRAVILALITCYAAWWIVSKAMLRPPGSIDSASAVMGKVVIVGYGIMFLFRELKSNTARIWHNPLFWVAVGTLLYAEGTIIIFGMADVLTKMGAKYFLMAWNINYGLIIIANILFMKSFLCKNP